MKEYGTRFNGTEEVEELDDQPQKVTQVQSLERIIYRRVILRVRVSLHSIKSLHHIKQNAHKSETELSE